MYQNLYYNKATNDMHLWDDTKGYQLLKYNPYCYRITDDNNNEFQHLNGFNVEKYFGKSLPTDYEIDVPATTRFLIDNYTDTVPSKNIRTLYFDIEVEKTEKGWSNSLETENRIECINVYINNTYHIFTLNSINPEFGENIYIFDNEAGLLQAFIQFFAEYAPHIISHWNGDKYDIPYICNRILMVLDDGWLNKLSPIGVVKPSKGFDESKWLIAGVSSLDYMLLYKIFTYKGSKSYSLEYIYKTVFGFSCHSNQTQLKKLIRIDNKFNFIELARKICHKGFVRYDDIFMTSRWLEGMCITQLNKGGLVSSNKNKIYNHVNTYHNKKATELHMVSDINPNLGGLLKIYKDTNNFYLVRFTHTNGNIYYLDKPLRFNVNITDIILPFKLNIFDGKHQSGLYNSSYHLDISGVTTNIINDCLHIKNNTNILSTLLSNWAKDKNGLKDVLTNGLKECLVQPNFRYFDNDTVTHVNTIIKNRIDERVNEINLLLNDLLSSTNINYITIITNEEIIIDISKVLKKYNITTNLSEVNTLLEPILTNGNSYITTKRMQLNDNSYIQHKICDSSSTVETVMDVDELLNNLPSILQSTLVVILNNILLGHTQSQIDLYLSDFKDSFVDYDMMYSKFTKKVQDVYDACGWGEINLNKDVAFFFDF